MGCSLLFFIFMGAFGTIRAHADDLSDILKLNENLPKAVCDESMISRAPSFEAVSELRKAASNFSFEVHVPASEPQVLSFLMGDQTTLIGAPQVLALSKAQSAGSLSDLKRKVSLEVCTSLVTPGKLHGLLTAKPEWTLAAAPEVSGKGGRASASQKEGAQFVLRDVEGRFGKFGPKWYIPGWLEPYEALQATVGKRRYERLANPITNHTQFILMMKPDETPLGFFAPATDSPNVNWDVLKAKAESESNQQRKMEVYRLLIELEAYRAVAGAPDHADSVRKLQEFYKNLIAAYQIYPDGEQFAHYAKKAKGSAQSAEAEAHALLDTGFMQALDGARINGNRVALYLFTPDPKLAAILQEYRKRLREL